MTTYPNLEIRSSQLNFSEPFADFNHCINCSFEVTICNSRQMKFVPKHPKTKFGICRILANNLYIYIYYAIYIVRLICSTMCVFALSAPCPFHWPLTSIWFHKSIQISESWGKFPIWQVAGRCVYAHVRHVSYLAYSRWTKYSNPAARTMLNPRTPKSQCFSARVSKSDVRGLIFFVHWG